MLISFNLSLKKIGYKLENINKMKKTGLDRQLFYAKILFGVGLAAFIFFPQYAYYWKKSTMDVNSSIY